MPASCSRLTYFFAEQQTLSLKIKKNWAKAYNLNHVSNIEVINYAGEPT